MLDLEEPEDLEQSSQKQGRAGHYSSQSQLSKKNCEQNPDFFENIDNIDVNIEETYSANQQQLYIQNFSNLGNLS